MYSTSLADVLVAHAEAEETVSGSNWYVSTYTFHDLGHVCSRVWRTSPYG